MRSIKTILFLIGFTILLVSFGWLYFLFVESFIDLSALWMIITIIILSAISKFIMIPLMLLLGLLYYLKPYPVFSKWASRIVLYTWGFLCFLVTLDMLREYQISSFLGIVLLALVILGIVIWVHSFIGKGTRQLIEEDIMQSPL